MNGKLEKIRTISNRLARSLAVLVAISIPGALYAYTHPGSIITSPPMACFIVGVIGGFVGLQRRLKKMSEDDLTLLANSWVYICLAPLVGGILAVVTYVLFVSGLLAGDLFPHFEPDVVSNASAAKNPGLEVIFAIHGNASDYGKMIFWCLSPAFPNGSSRTSSAALRTSLRRRIKQKPPRHRIPAKLELCHLTSRRSQPPLTLSVPLSRFTPGASGGSARSR
jgi:hypothetical protein